MMDTVIKGYIRQITVTLFLLCCVVMPYEAFSAEQPAATSVTGAWLAEPVLGQLGLIQVSYTFKADGSFSQKLNMLSFCGRGAVTPDCEYFWFVTDGKYTVSGSVLRLHIEKKRDILKLQGQSVPRIRDDGGTPVPALVEYSIANDQGKLILTDKKGNAQTFLPENKRK